MSKPIGDAVERFMKKVAKTGECWIWMGSVNNKGYPKFSHKAGAWMLAHRWSFERFVGPTGGLCVLHNCPSGDNPRCVNPGHLFLGTKADNNADMDAKGRRVPHRGEKSPFVKKTEAEVLEIRRLHDEGLATRKELAERFGLSLGGIVGIIKRRTWKHLTGDRHEQES